MVNRERKAWPPACEYGGCDDVAEAGLVEVDFGSGGKKPVRLCAEHRARLLAPVKVKVAA